MKKQKTKRPRGLSLYPMSTDEALRRMLSTPLPPGERRKRRKKRQPKAAEEE